MTIQSWSAEEARFNSLSKQERFEWLVRLLYLLSMLARQTYEVGAEGVSEPQDLRRFNELIHRTASFLKELSHDNQKVPSKDFFSLLERETVSLKIDRDDLLKRLQ